MMWSLFFSYLFHLVVFNCQRRFWFTYHGHFSVFLQPGYFLHAFTGHTSHVMSLDFHPKKNEICCSCDANNEIRFWNVNQYSCTRVFKASIGSFLLFVVLLRYFMLHWIWFVLPSDLSSVMTREVQRRWDFSQEWDNFWLPQQRMLCPSLMLRLIGRRTHYG